MPATTASPAGVPEKSAITLYRASAGRRTAVSFVFLLLLPFFASLPAMLYLRVAHGLWLDTAGFLVFAFFFLLLMILVITELIKSLRKRIIIGEKSVKLTVPASPGPTPKFAYKSYEIPFDQISAIEIRREVYGGAIAPAMLRAARILTKDGAIIPIGYVSEANTDPAFPVPEIAAEIARRAGAPLLDRGTVRRSFRRRLLGLHTVPGREEVFTDEDIAALNRRHNVFVLVLVFVLVILVGVGITLDVLGVGQ